MPFSEFGGDLPFDDGGVPGDHGDELPPVPLADDTQATEADSWAGAADGQVNVNPDLLNGPDPGETAGPDIDTGASDVTGWDEPLGSAAEVDGSQVDGDAADEAAPADDSTPKDNQGKATGVQGFNLEGLDEDQRTAQITYKTMLDHADRLGEEAERLREAAANGEAVDPLDIENAQLVHGQAVDDHWAFMGANAELLASGPRGDRPPADNEPANGGGETPTAGGASEAGAQDGSGNAKPGDGAGDSGGKGPTAPGPADSGDDDPLGALEKGFGLSEDQALLNAVGRYQSQVGPDSSIVLPITDSSEPHLTYVGPSSLYLETAAEHEPGEITGFPVGHLDPGTGQHIFYPELVTADEATTLEAAARVAHDNQRTQEREFFAGKGTVFMDVEHPVVQELVRHQQAELKDSGLAARLVERHNDTPGSTSRIDEATSCHLRFFPETHGRYGEPDYLSIPEARVMVEMHGVIDERNVTRSIDYIEIGKMSGFDASEGYTPNELLITPDEYATHVAPLIDEIRAAQQQHPRLEWSDGPAMIDRKPPRNDDPGPIETG